MMGLTHVLAFTLGILAVHTQQALPPAALLLLLAVPALAPWRGRAHYAWFALALLLTCWRAQSLLDERWPASRHDEERVVQGHVASLPEISQRTGNGAQAEITQRFLFEPSDENLPRRIRVAWYRSAENIGGGEFWSFKLRLKSPHGSLSPGAFDYEGWLFRQGIGATATVRDAQRCADAPGYRLLKLRQALVDRIREWLPADPAAGMIAALTLGDESGLSDADWEIFRLTGTTHLVAISGFNIAIVAGVAFFLCRWLWSLWPPLLLRLPAQKAGMLGSAVIALLYALLAGFEAPVARAVLMLWIILAAAWLQRLAQPARVLALAWLLILAADPFAVMAPGLWLSFGAVAAIFYVTTGRAATPDPLRAALLLQLMLSVALTPLTLWFFHGASWCGPLVNLIAVPLFSLLTPILLAALMLAAVWPSIGIPALSGCAHFLQQVHDALAWTALHLPQVWIPAAPPAAALLLALLGSILLFAPRGLPLRRTALLCFLPLLFPPNTAPRSGFELAAFDVGQGLAVVVRTAQHSMVFDTGPGFEEGFNAGASVVAPYLLTQGVRELDLMLISHADNDHSGGASALRRLLHVDDELGALTPRACADGQHWEWDGVRFDLLHPDAEHWSSNNGGCVLRVAAGAHAVLLPADIERPAELRLVRDHADLLRADLVLAPHHGSKTSSTAEFIAAMQPERVIYSAGWHHQFHHPHPSVVRRYFEAGARGWSTAASGTLSLRVTADDGMGVMHEYRRESAKFWNAPAENAWWNLAEAQKQADGPLPNTVIK